MALGGVRYPRAVGRFGIAVEDHSEEYGFGSANPGTPRNRTRVE